MVCAQVPWDGEFEHDAGRELFGSNLLSLTWIKGEPMPSELVDEILRGLGLERETEAQQRKRLTLRASKRAFGAADGKRMHMSRRPVS